MEDKTPIYYFCKDAEIQFITRSEYILLSFEERQKYNPATFRDVRIHGSDELKKEIEPLKQASMAHSHFWGSLK